MNFFRNWRLIGGRTFATLFGGLFFSKALLGPDLSTVVYSAAPVPDLADSNNFIVTATNNTALVLGAPLFGGLAMSATNPGVGMTWIFTISNTSGGAMGALTFNAIFKTAGAFTVPADTTKRSICFRWNGTNHVELWRGAADVAN